MTNVPYSLANSNAFVPVATSMLTLSTVTSQGDNSNAKITLAGLANAQISQQYLLWDYYSAHQLQVGELISLGMARDALTLPSVVELLGQFQRFGKV